MGEFKGNLGNMYVVEGGMGQGGRCGMDWSIIGKQDRVQGSFRIKVLSPCPTHNREQTKAR